jgi:hypothetical protein
LAALTCLLAIVSAGAVAAPGEALASAPSWKVVVTHVNPYGEQCSPQQLAEVEGGDIDPEAPCGLDPFTDSATSFDRGSGHNEYEIAVENAGPGEVAHDPTDAVTVRDVLPAGVWFMEGRPSEVNNGGAGGEGELSDWTCGLSGVAPGEGPHVLTCALSASAPALASGQRYQTIKVRAWAAKDAPASVTNEATVSGGGAVPESEHFADPTTIAAAVPFGIYEFRFDDLHHMSPTAYGAEDVATHEIEECEVATERLVECAGTEQRNGRDPLPATHAGGHPFAVYTRLVFNFTSRFDGALTTVGAGQQPYGPGVKQIEARLPAGLVGDPLAVPPCPLQYVEEHRSGEECKAVGYMNFADTSGTISKGRPNFILGQKVEPIYNVVPPPGYPAAFAVLATQLKAVVILYPKVVATTPTEGSPGGVEYSLETGVEASAPLRAADITFCGDGVAEPDTPAIHCEQSSELGRGVPFLTNPTQCSGSLRAALSSAPYPTGEPASEPTGPAVMEAYLNGPSGPPALIDDEYLTFASIGGHQVPVDEPGLGPVPLPQQGVQAATLSGCEELRFKPTLRVQPPSGDAPIAANSPTAMDIELTVPRAETEVSTVVEGPHAVTERVTEKAAEADVRDVRLELPEGITLSPSAAQGLQACTDAEFELGSTAEGHCPLASQVGTAEVTTPLLASPTTGEAHRPGEPGQLQGQLFIGQPECASVLHPEPCEGSAAQSGKLYRLFLQLQDRRAGVVLKLRGTAKVDPTTGLLRTSFEDQPQLPFEKLVVHLKGGPRAPFAAVHQCGRYRADSEVTAWAADAEELEHGSEFETAGREGAEGPTTYRGSTSTFDPSAEPTASTEAEFEVHCSQEVAPFAPAFNAGTAYPQAGAYSAFSVTVTPTERAELAEEEQGLRGIELRTPPGLTGKLSAVPLCSEAPANAGTCPAESQIGSATVLVGPGTHPLKQEGKVYLTGPTNGDPFGIVTVVSAVAGPYNLGQVVVRAGIAIDPITAAVTVTSAAFPQYLDGVPLRIRSLNVDIDGHGHDFIRNPTSCGTQQVSATLTSEEGVSYAGASRFGVGGCHALSFHPALSVTTQAKTSRLDGASLTVKISQASGEDDLKRVDIQLPSALPSRQSTLVQACTLKQFEQLPVGSACPEGSRVGTATARTPLLRGSLSGPAILVSRGGAAFPDLEFLLEGEGVHIDLIGHTQIKDGVTSSLFETIPDQPIESFETVLPEGPHSILAANGNLCDEALALPTTIEAQNGAVLHPSIAASVAGCPPVHKHQQLTKALKRCRQRNRHHRRRRVSCERKARKRYGAGASSARALPRPDNSLTDSLATAAAGVQGALQTVTSELQRRSAEPGPGECPNDVLRAESNIDPLTAKPYSEGLPECRAYELVSPADKSGYAAGIPAGNPTVISPNGEAVGWSAGGDFADPSSFLIAGATPSNKYISRRSEATAGTPAWSTSSALVPAGISDEQFAANPLASDFSPSLSSEAGCGPSFSGGYICARLMEDGIWSPTPNYQLPSGAVTLAVEAPDQAQSADLKRIFLLPGIPLLTQDTLEDGGLYELFGAGRSGSVLRLVNVRRGAGGETEQLGMPEHLLYTNGSDAPFLGDASDHSGVVAGTAYHAVSNTGETVFFTARPTGRPGDSIFARIRCEEGESCEYADTEGGAVPESGRTTVDVTCANETEGREGRCKAESELSPGQSAVFQGASEDGSKVFFTVNSVLWEYEFGEAPALHRIASAVAGVVRTSPDGSRVYYVAEGELSDKDTVTGAVQHIAPLPGRDDALWGVGSPAGDVNAEECLGEIARYVACDSGSRYAQTTHDGRYLVFSTHAALPTGPNPQTEDRNGCEGAEEEQVPVCKAEAIYRWDAEGGPSGNGELTWVSRAVPGTPEPDGGLGASVPAIPGTSGSLADIDDIARAVSETGDVVFGSREKLSVDDTAGRPQVYLWHCTAPCPRATEEGSVSMISDGQLRSAPAGISATGNDVFFYTPAQLVSQDDDELSDLYDARVDGGAAAAVEPPSCVGEACQEPLAAEPVFGPAASSVFGGA